ncbi:MAG: hypothetical protein HY708_00580 [Ignavibacteriae bacterium]|nr:hypothetical protein [Ignavibacteriota bacterium]
MESNVAASPEIKAIEGSLRALWERTKRAGELIAQLRQEKRAFQARTEELEGEVSHLKEALATKEQLIKKLSVAQQVSESKENLVFSNGEREALMSKVKELIARIDAYL